MRNSPQAKSDARQMSMVSPSFNAQEKLYNLRRHMKERKKGKRQMERVKSIVLNNVSALEKQPHRLDNL